MMMDEEVGEMNGWYGFGTASVLLVLLLLSYIPYLGWWIRFLQTATILLPVVAALFHREIIEIIYQSINRIEIIIIIHSRRYSSTTSTSTADTPKIQYHLIFIK